MSSMAEAPPHIGLCPFQCRHSMHKLSDKSADGRGRVGAMRFFRHQKEHNSAVVMGSSKDHNNEDHLSIGVVTPTKSIRASLQSPWVRRLQPSNNSKGESPEKHGPVCSHFTKDFSSCRRLSTDGFWREYCLPDKMDVCRTLAGSSKTYGFPIRENMGTCISTDEDTESTGTSTRNVRLFFPARNNAGGLIPVSENRGRRALDTTGYGDYNRLSDLSFYPAPVSCHASKCKADDVLHASAEADGIKTGILHHIITVIAKRVEQGSRSNFSGRIHKCVVESKSLEGSGRTDDHEQMVQKLSTGSFLGSCTPSHSKSESFLSEHILDIIHESKPKAGIEGVGDGGNICHSTSYKSTRALMGSLKKKGNANGSFLHCDRHQTLGTSIAADMTSPRSHASLKPGGNSSQCQIYPDESEARFTSAQADAWFGRWLGSKIHAEHLDGNEGNAMQESRSHISLAAEESEKRRSTIYSCSIVNDARGRPFPRSNSFQR